MMIAENCRYRPLFQKAKQLMDDGLIGTAYAAIWNIFVHATNKNIYLRTKWRQAPKHIGGLITDSRALPIIITPEMSNDPDIHKRIQELEQQVSTWHHCDTIRAYLNAVERKAVKKFGKIEKGSSIDQWLCFGYDYADSLDPSIQVVEWFERDSNPIVRTVKKL